MQPPRLHPSTHSSHPIAFFSSPTLPLPHVSTFPSVPRLSPTFTAATVPARVTTKLPRCRRSIVLHLSTPPRSSTSQIQRFSPSNHPNPAENSTTSHTSTPSFSRSILYSPLLFSFVAYPLSALSQDTSTNPATATLPADTFPENDALTNFLSSTIIFLLVYVSIGVIILTIRNFLANRNEERHIAVLEQLIRENPGSNTLFDSYDDIEQVKDLVKQKPAPTSKSTPLPRPGGNRQFRRVEKKLREKELRAEKRKQKLADKASAVKNQDSSSSSKSS